jgi:N-acylneuraminate cytidylyltransferase
MNNVVAIIPARGGSKRLPGKNILPLAGKPMIAWTIEAALKSGIFSDILVSTDSRKIADISRRCGASVPFLRDTRLADDHTPVSLATVQALKQIEEHTGKNYNTVVQLMPNCPYRKASDIRNAYKQFLKTRANFQISVFKFGWMNPWWAMRLIGGKKPSPLFPAAYKKRSQDLEALYCPTGAIWIADCMALKKEKTFYGKGFRVFPLDWQSAVDIDDREDLHMAQAVFTMRQNLIRQ